jgi:hypothetical protein
LSFDAMHLSASRRRTRLLRPPGFRGCRIYCNFAAVRMLYPHSDTGASAYASSRIDLLAARTKYLMRPSLQEAGLAALQSMSCKAAGIEPTAHDTARVMTPDRARRASDTEPNLNCPQEICGRRGRELAGDGERDSIVDLVRLYMGESESYERLQWY